MYVGIFIYYVCTCCGLSPKLLFEGSKDLDRVSDEEDVVCVRDKRGQVQANDMLRHVLHVHNLLAAAAATTITTTRGTKHNFFNHFCSILGMACKELIEVRTFVLEVGALVHVMGIERFIYGTGVCSLGEGVEKGCGKGTRGGPDVDAGDGGGGGGVEGHGSARCRCLSLLRRWLVWQEGKHIGERLGKALLVTCDGKTKTTPVCLSVCVCVWLYVLVCVMCVVKVKKKWASEFQRETNKPSTIVLIDAPRIYTHRYQHDSSLTLQSSKGLLITFVRSPVTHTHHRSHTPPPSSPK
jgi:hypothetical protein